MAIEIVDLPIKNGGFFHSYGTVYQRVSYTTVLYVVTHQDHDNIHDNHICYQLHP